MTAEPVIGGRAWPSFRLEDPAWEAVIAVWLNTTLGLISRWAVSNRQHQGRATLTVTTLGRIPVLDPRRLSEAQIESIGDLVERERSSAMLPANEAYRDPQRHLMDTEVLHGVLGMPASLADSLDAMREIWSAEPSVHGGKPTRPSQLN